MPRKGRRAAKALRAREKALEAECTMVYRVGEEVLRGKELAEVKEFAEAHSRAQTTTANFPPFNWAQEKKENQYIARFSTGQRSISSALEYTRKGV